VCNERVRVQAKAVFSNVENRTETSLCRTADRRVDRSGPVPFLVKRSQSARRVDYGEPRARFIGLAGIFDRSRAELASRLAYAFVRLDRDRAAVTSRLHANRVSETLDRTGQRNAVRLMDTMPRDERASSYAFFEFSFFERQTKQERRRTLTPVAAIENARVVLGRGLSNNNERTRYTRI